jgi:hypothetical protein
VLYHLVILPGVGRHGTAAALRLDHSTLHDH